MHPESEYLRRRRFVLNYHMSRNTLLGAEMRKWVEELRPMEEIDLRVEDRLVDLAVGFTDGLAVMLVKVLEARELELSQEVRDRIRSDRITDNLEDWAELMMTVASAEELFEASAG